MKIKGHLDLFSGIGGFSLGLQRAGIEPEWIGFSDIDKYANKLFKRRFKDAEELGSITDVSYKSLRGRRIDLLTGGFPCQTFSIAGKRKGFDDTRGTLFFDIKRLLQDYIRNEKPISCILLENVKGLLNHDNGRTFATIYGILSNLNYTIECQLVNTKWWLPQNRERIYIFGRYNGNPSGRKIFPVFGITKETIRNKESKYMIADYRTDEGLRIRKDGNSPCLAAAHNSEKELSRMPPLYKVKSHSLFPRSSKTGKGGIGHLSKEDGTAYCLDTGNAQAIEYKTLNENQSKKLKDMKVDSSVSGTLTEAIGRGGSSSEYLKMLKKNQEITGKIRRLTPIECERLQGFPDNWTDGQSDTQRYKQCGNAVSVCVTEAIFRRIYEKSV